jgi:hypothetical protein
MSKLNKFFNSEDINIKLFMLQSTVQKLVRRMTRFFVKYTAEEAVEKLCMMLDKLGYSWRSYSPAIVSSICGV